MVEPTESESLYEIDRFIEAMTVIRAEIDKVPYVLVLGQKEAEAQSVSVRSRAKGDEGVQPFAQFFERLKAEIAAAGMDPEAPWTRARIEALRTELSRRDLAGFIVGVVLDRARKEPVLVVTNLLRAGGCLLFFFFHKFRLAGAPRGSRRPPTRRGRPSPPRQRPRTSPTRVRWW